MIQNSASTGLLLKGIKATFKSAHKYYSGMDIAKDVAMRVGSTGTKETHGGFASVPIFREWKGSRSSQGLDELTVEISSKRWQASIDVDLDTLEEDRSNGQFIDPSVKELARRAVQHRWGRLVTLLYSGTGTTYGQCFDGEAFFASTHGWADAGSQNNIVTGAATAGAQTAAEIRTDLGSALAAMVSFTDSEGEPFDESPVRAGSFLVVCPVAIMAAMEDALTSSQVSSTNVKPWNNVTMIASPRLDAASGGNDADSWYLLRTDSALKPLIHQVTYDIRNTYTGAISTGGQVDSQVFDTNKIRYGAHFKDEMGYGLWPYAIKVSVS